jgi:hypothetical protein
MVCRPGIDLGANVIAVPDIEEAVKGATALVFVLPHQVSFFPYQPGPGPLSESRRYATVQGML